MASQFFKVGEVRVATDEDFQYFKSLCDIADGWSSVYSKKGVDVWVKENGDCQFKMFKVRTVYSDLPAEVLYDVLHDPEYRKTWDHHMIDSKDVCMLNPNNDIGYYLMRLPRPIKPREFVMQRSWLDTPKEKVIFNHSVNHRQFPKQKSAIRGISYLAGYLIRTLDAKRTQFTYIAHSNPHGNLPAWAINKLTTYVAPKVTVRMWKAAQKYDAWKKKNKPGFKPWLYPEQMIEVYPRLDFGDVEELTEDTEEGVEREEVTEEALEELDDSALEQFCP